MELVKLKSGSILETRAVEAGDVIEVCRIRMALGRIAPDHLLARGRVLSAETIARLETLAGNALAFAEQDDKCRPCRTTWNSSRKSSRRPGCAA